MAIDVSVVVVSYNRKRFLKKCLECLLWQDYPEDNYEIIVVDDGSTDGTDKMFEMMDYPQRVRYFCSPERLGQSKARNRGIFEAKGEVIIFTDSDAFAPPWFIREHMVWHQKDSKLIVDGPYIEMVLMAFANKTCKTIIVQLRNRAKTYDELLGVVKSKFRLDLALRRLEELRIIKEENGKYALNIKEIVLRFR